MPQLDLLILQSQVNFFVVFFIGYFIFLKYVLPIISFFLKMKYKLIVSNLNWLKLNSQHLIFYKKSFLVSLIKLSSLFQLIDYIERDRFVFFNLYSFDYYFVRTVYKK